MSPLICLTDIHIIYASIHYYTFVDLLYKQLYIYTSIHMYMSLLVSRSEAVVLAPTRELCSQIHLEAKKLSFASPIRAGEVYGGVDAKPQLLDLARGVDLVTATPGEVPKDSSSSYDHIKSCIYYYTICV